MTNSDKYSGHSMKGNNSEKRVWRHRKVNFHANNYLSKWTFPENQAFHIWFEESTENSHFTALFFLLWSCVNVKSEISFTQRIKQRNGDIPKPSWISRNTHLSQQCCLIGRRRWAWQVGQRIHFHFRSDFCAPRSPVNDTLIRTDPIDGTCNVTSTGKGGHLVCWYYLWFPVQFGIF